jgi:hypothetical protein
MSFRTPGTRSLLYKTTALVAVTTILILASTRLRADTGTCSGQSLTLPFTDVPSSNVFFCSIAQAFFSGLTNGTTPTTYSPGANVLREQMAAFTSRTQDSALKRGSSRAAAGQWATPLDVGVLKFTPVGGNPHFSCFDGEDIWVASIGGATVTRVHASDGRVLGTWTGATSAYSTISAAGFIYATGAVDFGRIYRIDPANAPGAVTVVENNLAGAPVSITYDGSNIWVPVENALNVVSTSTPARLLATLTGNGLGATNQAVAFDGERIMVTSFVGSVSLWKASSLTPLGNLNQGSGVNAFGVCSDGLHFWVVNNPVGFANDGLLRF